MREALRKMQEEFGNTKAVFRGTKNSSGDLDFISEHIYDPKTVNLDHQDPVVKLMISNYREGFDKNSTKYVKSENTINSTISDMFADLRRALHSASPHKNPQQSKLYKWFANSSTIETLSRYEGIIALYKYVYVNTDALRQFSGTNNVHAKNLIAIIEKMKEKYEQTR